MIGLYMEQVKKVPLLTQEQENDLVLRYRAGDESAAHELVQANLRFVVKIASKYKNYGISLLDLVQEGNIGMLQALKKFEVGRVRFISYAVYWIRAFILSYVMRNWSMVKMTTRQRNNFFRLRRQESIPELAQELGLTEDEVRNDRSIAVHHTGSLDYPIGEDQSTLMVDTLVDENPQPEQVCVDADTSSKLVSWQKAIMLCLNPRERTIVESRILSDDPITCEELGFLMNCSKAHIQQLEQRAIKKMRRAALLRLPPLALGGTQCARYLEPLKNAILSCSESEAV